MSREEFMTALKAQLMDISAEERYSRIPGIKPVLIRNPDPKTAIYGRFC